MFSHPRFLRPSDAFLQNFLNKLNGHSFQIFANFFRCYAILTCLWKIMTQTSSLEAFFQPKRFTTYKRFQCNSHGIEIRTFIFDIGNDFFLKPYLSNKSFKILAKACFVISLTSNKPIVTCFGYHSLPKKLMTNANAS